MTISEVIARLSAIQCEVGDVDCITLDSEVAGFRPIITGIVVERMKRLDDRDYLADRNSDNDYHKHIQPRPVAFFEY